jgi:Flp pilus assembly pilin Flp
MQNTLTHFLRDESGQDLIEHGLLVAFVVLVAVSLFASTGSSVAGIWSSANTQISTANSSLQPDNATSNPPGDQHGDQHGDHGGSH